MYYKTNVKCPLCGHEIFIEDECGYICSHCKENFTREELLLPENEKFRVYIPIIYRQGKDICQKLKSNYQLDFHWREKCNYDEIEAIYCYIPEEVDFIYLIRNAIFPLLSNLYIFPDKCIGEYTTLDNPYIKYHCLIDVDSDDIAAALEETFHLLKEVGATDDQIEEIMNIVDLDPGEDPEQYFTIIDQGYSLRGNLMTFNKKQNSMT